MSLRFLSTCLLVVATALVSAGAGSAAPASASGGFLFVTFKGEQTPMSEQVYFGLSRDGRDWSALNGGEPVLVSHLGEQGVRDPFVLRAHDGSKFYLIATDLSIHLTKHNWSRAVRAGSRCIVVWESPDLVHWSAPRLVAVAPEDAGCTWAPEAIYDEETRDYLVFWASTTKRDDFAKHRIWAARTKDFATFGEPFIYIERPVAVIDTDIVHDGRSYYRFSKDETYKAISLERAATLTGEWQPVPDFSLARMTGYEGPAAFVLEPASAGRHATWCLLLDYYSKGQGYQAFVTQDIAKGQFTATDAVKFPFRFRHGSVLPITPQEFAGLQAAYGAQP